MAIFRSATQEQSVKESDNQASHQQPGLVLRETLGNYCCSFRNGLDLQSLFKKCHAGCFTVNFDGIRALVINFRGRVIGLNFVLEAVSLSCDSLLASVCIVCCCEL